MPSPLKYSSIRTAEHNPDRQAPVLAPLLPPYLIKAESLGDEMREIHPPGDARVHLYPQEVSVLVVVQRGGRRDLLGAVDGSVGYLREGKVERIGVRIEAHSQTITPSKGQGRNSSKDTLARLLVQVKTPALD